MKGRVFGPPTLSPDGKTLKFPELGLSTREVSEKCQPGTTGKVCQIRIQVVNGYGQVSNVVYYQVFISDKPLNFFSSAYALDSPTNLNVAAGALEVEVLRINVRADSQNQDDIDDIYVGDLLIQTSPPSLYIDCANTFGHFKAVNVETGEVIGMGGMGPSFGGNQGCWTFFSLSPVITLPPGTEKALVVKMNLGPQAPVGLQFWLGATPGPGGPYIGWVDYPGPQGSGNSITIVAP